MVVGRKKIGAAILRIHRFDAPFCHTERQRQLVEQANYLLKNRAAPHERPQAEWQEVHRKRFLKSRWFREGRTFEWWLNRRRKMRRIAKQRQRAAANRPHHRHLHRPWE